MPKWVQDPSPAWREEGESINQSDAKIGAIKLAAQNIAALTRVTRELVEDTGNALEDALRRAFAAQIALSWDAKALYGSGLDEPAGVKAVAAQTSMGTNGATIAAGNGTSTGWDLLVDAVGALQDVNEQPNGVIYAPRTDREFAKLKDSQGRYLIPPGILDSVPRYSTNQVPTNLTQGSANTASDIFVGDWSQLYVGVHTELIITVLRERYADTGEIGLVAW